MYLISTIIMIKAGMCSHSNLITLYQTLYHRQIVLACSHSYYLYTNRRTSKRERIREYIWFMLKRYVSIISFEPKTTPIQHSSSTCLSRGRHMHIQSTAFLVNVCMHAHSLSIVMHVGGMIPEIELWLYKYSYQMNK